MSSGDTTHAGAVLSLHLGEDKIHGAIRLERKSTPLVTGHLGKDEHDGHLCVEASVF